MNIMPFIPITMSLIITILLLVVIKKKSVTEIMIIIHIFIISINPVIINNKESNLNILFVLDTRPKMNIEKAKQDINHIIDNTNKPKISLLTFSNYSKKIIPYTYDKYYIKNIINNISTIPESLLINKNLETNDIIKENIDSNTIIIIMSYDKNIINNLNIKNRIFINYSNKNNKLNRIIKTINKKENQLQIYYKEIYYIIALLILIFFIIDFKNFRSRIS